VAWPDSSEGDGDTLEKGTEPKNMLCMLMGRKARCRVRKQGRQGLAKARNYSIVKLPPAACSECLSASAAFSSAEMLHKHLAIF